MSSENQKGGKKRSKAFYRKSAYSNKRQKVGANVLQPDIRGFLIMCNSNESNAVREAYNILNEYGDFVFGPYKPGVPADGSTKKPASSIDENSGEDEDDCLDVEEALKKEVASIKNVTSTERRFQNVATKAKNCVFIRTTVEDPVKLVVTAMEDIAERKLNRARYAARMLPIIGTCKAQTDAICGLAKEVLKPYLSRDLCENPPKSFTIIFKARNNSGTACGKESVISDVRKIALDINPDLSFSWSDYEVAVLVEIVCNVCCLGLAPDFHRLRKYNFQELSQGPRVSTKNETQKTETEIEIADGEESAKKTITVKNSDTKFEASEICETVEMAEKELTDNSDNLRGRNIHQKEGQVENSCETVCDLENLKNADAKENDFSPPEAVTEIVKDEENVSKQTEDA